MIKLRAKKRFGKMDIGDFSELGGVYAALVVSQSISSLKDLCELLNEFDIHEKQREKILECCNDLLDVQNALENGYYEQ